MDATRAQLEQWDRDHLWHPFTPMQPYAAERPLIVERAEGSGRVAMVGHTFLYSPPVLHLKSAVDAGELGDVQYLYSQRLSLGRIRRDCNALWNFAPHDVSIMIFLLDELPSEVSATSMTMMKKLGSERTMSTRRMSMLSTRPPT